MNINQHVTLKFNKLKSYEETKLSWQVIKMHAYTSNRKKNSA